MTSDILFEQTGSWGVITLNYEKAFIWDIANAMRVLVAQDELREDQA